MSLSYQVSLRIQEVVSADDEITHKLDLREILGRESMIELLKAALEEAGFEQESDTTMARTDDNGVTQSVDLESLEVTASMEVEKELSGQASSRGTSQKDAQRRAREQVANVVESGQRDVQREVTAALEKDEDARLEELNSILQGVYAEALKRKAPTMGDVVEVTEGTNAAGDYELTIRVEV